MCEKTMEFAISKGVRMQDVKDAKIAHLRKTEEICGTGIYCEVLQDGKKFVVL